jgi:putative methionine-R-sulfoxide reductase with GAF domain
VYAEPFKGQETGMIGIPVKTGIGVNLNLPGKNKSIFINNVRKIPGSGACAGKT